jgi:superfamily II DNA or RNA helicase
MSVKVPLNIFSLAEKQQILQKLTVKAQSKNKNYKNETVLYTFDIITDNSEDYILLPFFYCYNFISSKLNKHNLCVKYPNDHKKFKIYEKSNKFEFPCKLMEKQEKIKAEVFEILNRTHSLIISSFTGFGKTFFALYLSYKIGLITAISVNKKKLIDQWIDNIKKFCPKATYQVIKSKTKIDPTVNFYIFNMINITKRHITDFNHVGLLICDEIHTLCTPTNSKILFHFQPKYLIGLSATPYRTDKLSDLIHLYFGIEPITKELYRPFNIYCCYTDFKPKIKENSDGSINWNSIIESICNEDIIDLVVEIARFFINRNILILTKRVEIEGKIYFEKLKNYSENVDIITAEKDDFDENCRILISTTSKGGVGFDFPKLDMLIVASDMEENFTQYLGRVFRKEETYPIVIDIVHNKFFPLYKHFKTRKEIYEKTGGETKNIFTYFPELDKFLNYYKPLKIY